MVVALFVRNNILYYDHKNSSGHFRIIAYPTQRG